MAALTQQGFDKIQKGRQAAVSITICTDTSGGDVDRYINAALDGLSRGGVYEDDRQVMGEGCIQAINYFTRAHGIRPEDAEMVIEVWDNGELGS